MFQVNNNEDIIPGTDRDMLDALNDYEAEDPDHVHEWQIQSSMRKNKRKSIFGSPQSLDKGNTHSFDNYQGSSIYQNQLNHSNRKKSIDRQNI